MDGMEKARANDDAQKQKLGLGVLARDRSRIPSRIHHHRRKLRPPNYTDTLLPSRAQLLAKPILLKLLSQDISGNVLIQPGEFKLLRHQPHRQAVRSACMSRPCLRLFQLAPRPLHQSWPRLYSTRPTPSSVNGNTTPIQSPAYRDHYSTHSTPNHDGSSTTTASSVNASEVSHFTTLASSWWDPHGPSRLLHLMNPLRHDFIKSCLASNPSTISPSQPTYTYLDIGCGGGIFASSAARLPTTHSVTAIDPTPSVIAVARAHQRTDPLLLSRLTYLNTSIEELSAHTTPPPAGYDFISLFEVIEHIDRPAAFLRDALKHLRVGGWLVGSTIARHPLSYLTTKVVAEAPWPVGVVPKGTHDWDKYINPGELGAWFELENRLARERGEEGGDVYGPVRIEGCVYVPVMGWKFVKGSEEVGNYFFGVQKLREGGRSSQEVDS